MRDPKRIDKLLSLIREIWIKYPDMRLLQLLIGASAYKEVILRDPFYVEDYTLEEKLLLYKKL